jgi:hypothetical protein
MNLRKGKTKIILEAAIDAALLAVEVYNKPRTTFRSEAYIALMIIAWTRLLHAHFNVNIGDKYYYKEKKKNRYKKIDGERKAWELTKCLEEYGRLNKAVKKNLEFFIKLRNKIEHRHIDKKDVDVIIFGECQALLYNFENTLINLFGKEFALNESLVYSLQFSHLRTTGQQSASKVALSKDMKNIVDYVDKYRSTLRDDVFESQEYSIKLLQIPKISNTNRSDLAIEFVRWEELNEADKDKIQKATALIKDKKVKVEAVNVGKLKPGDVVARIKDAIPGTNFSIHTHTCLHKLFRIRPPSNTDNLSNTNSDYCQYDEAHNDYVYNESWAKLITNILLSNRLSVKGIHSANRNKEKLNIHEYSS